MSASVEEPSQVAIIKVQGKLDNTLLRVGLPESIFT